MGKGRFTRFDLCKDGTAYLQFDYKKTFFRVNDLRAKDYLEEYLMREFMGLIDVKVVVSGKKIMIFLHLGYSAKNIEEGIPFTIWLEDQAKGLSRMCSNY